jgi:hypothetical protein
MRQRWWCASFFAFALASGALQKRFQLKDKFMKHASIALYTGLALLCLCGACSSAMAEPVLLPTVSVTAFELERQEIALQTTVVHVDKTNKTVTLKGPEGQEETIEVGGNLRDAS